MNFPLWDYLKQECGPHWRTLVLDRQILIGVGAVALAVRWPGAPASFTIGKLTELSLSYGATTLGFALTIYTLALTLPQPGVVELLASHREKRESTDAYAKLLFVFSWTAVSQCLLVMSAFVSQLSLDLSLPVRRIGFSFQRDFLLYVTVFLLVYAVLQFLSAILTVAQLGRIISGHVRRSVVAKQQRAALATVKKEEFGS
jgi:hypothetical protein